MPPMIYDAAMAKRGSVEAAETQSAATGRATILRKPQTVHDIARLAGVSTATVNRVVQKRGYVAEETRFRVVEALRITGYRPSALARGLRTKRSFTIGHVLTAITSNPFFVRVARSVEEEALKHGFKTFLFNHNGNRDRERLGIERFVDRRVDAIIFTNARDGENVQAALDAGVPVVQVERITTVKTAAAIVDNFVGAVDAMQHLLTLGHQRIAFIGGDPNRAAAGGSGDATVEMERLSAYQQQLRRAGIAIDPAFIRLGPYYGEDGSGEYGHEHMQALLGLANRPTAIFATCDILAAGALQALYEAKLRIPDDVSIIGFDDTLAANLTPPLTTVAQPMDELGRRAFRLALDAIEGRDSGSPIKLSTHLRIRRSTGAPPIA